MARGTVNKVILIGRLGFDPEIRCMPSGMSVANLRLATNDGYKDRQTGQFIENTEWHRVALFGKQAETVTQYAKKGSLLYIEGRIRTNKWQDQSGQDRYTTEIVATEMQLMNVRNENQNFEDQQGKDYIKPDFNQPSPESTQSRSVSSVTGTGMDSDLEKINEFDNDKDIPF